MTTETLTAPARSWIVSIGDALSAMGEKSEMARRARVAKRLYAMSDQELAEIGLGRGEVLRHAFGPYLSV
jgi:hypothetical protein